MYYKEKNRYYIKHIKFNVLFVVEQRKVKKSCSVLEKFKIICIIYNTAIADNCILQSLIQNLLMVYVGPKTQVTTE